ncbi:N-6 DNA methylase [Nocardia sp. NPDC057668]|uniref:N-6 DNA methylase n=1 Tax=Nocardia sp. NPDC057668 TaxID=3346202 RepID=UPI00366C1D2F
MSKPTSRVNAAEISRLTGRTRATVSNWRRRHADFPKPTPGSSETRPTFDLNEVQEWLVAHGVEATESPATELRTLVRSQATPDVAAQLMASLRRADDGWSSVGLGADQVGLAVAAADAFRRAVAAGDTRAAVDALAERALEGAQATGVYITPEPVAALIVALMASPGSSDVHGVLDPACGSGSLLLAAERAGATEIYGQDVLPVQVHRTRLLLEADGELEPVVQLGDSIAADAFPDLRVDAVLCNPPYGQRDWGSENLGFDARWDYGLPPRNESELAWVQHAVAHLSPGGTAVLLLPPAVASRPSGRKIRANLVRSGVLRAVIGLAPGAAQPWHVGLQIWMLRRQQSAVDSMLFVDTTGLTVKVDGEDRIDWEAVSDAAVRSWRVFDGSTPDDASVSGRTAVVRLVDVLDEEVDLTPARYVRSSLDAGTVADEVDASIRQLTTATTELNSVTAQLAGWSESAGRNWRFATIADLWKSGQLEWIRSDPPSSERPEPGDDRPVLTAPDVATGNPASGTWATASSVEQRFIESGDVLIPAVRSDRSGGRSARVADADDAGAIRGPHVHTLRADRARFDPWFLAGFLTGAENISATRTSTIRFDPSRLRIPVLPLDEQQRYGTLFRRLFQLRTAARRAGYAAEQVAELVTTGLTAGALIPGDAPDGAGHSR